MNWEYKVSNAPTTPRELQMVLDREGNEQWELVSTTLVTSRLLLLFKRPYENSENGALEESSAYSEVELHDEAAVMSDTGEETTA